MSGRIRPPYKSAKFGRFFLLVLFFLGVVNTSYADENEFRLRQNHLSQQIGSEEDIRAEVEFGRNIAARLLARFKLLQNRELNRYVNLVGQGIASFSSRSELEFHFGVIDTDTLNAYSTPGGYIFVTKGAIMAMKDESELAAVLAHEVAHVSERHIVKEFNIKGKDDSSVTGVTRLLGASQDSTRIAFSQAVDKAMEMLLDKGFKHQDERESDQVAIFLLAQSGYDPFALNRFLERSQKIGKEQAGKASPTHPATDERLNTIRSFIESEGLSKASFAKGEKRFNQYVRKN